WSRMLYLIGRSLLPRGECQVEAVLNRRFSASGSIASSAAAFGAVVVLLGAWTAWRAVQQQINSDRERAVADRAEAERWTLAFGQHKDRTPTHGYEATCEAAMAAFAKTWRRE